LPCLCALAMRRGILHRDGGLLNHLLGVREHAAL
jgi:hypothetical protein